MKNLDKAPGKKKLKIFQKLEYLRAMKQENINRSHETLINY